ncbi:MAG: sulfurtransferase [Hyphomicrobiaceae bacterium]
MRLKSLIAAALVVGAGSTAAQAADPLVDVAWVKANLGKPGIVMLDLRSGAGQPKEAYLKGHIPGSLYTDYAKGGWREKDKAGVAGMLPSVAKLEKLIGSLGIDNATHVVLIPLGAKAQDVGAATRLYWTFKVLGHDKVSVMNGGFRAWVKVVDKATKKPVNPLATGEVKPKPAVFKAKLRPELIATKEDVRKAIASKQPLVDNRPNDFFVGVTMSSAAKRPGTLPGASNLPESWLTDNNGGKFRSRAQLTPLYKAAGVGLDGEQINFCNTGHWASLGWFVSYAIMGNTKAKMYDGSMAEWTADKSLPVDQKVKMTPVTVEAR